MTGDKPNFDPDAAAAPATTNDRRQQLKRRGSTGALADKFEQGTVFKRKENRKNRMAAQKTQRSNLELLLQSDQERSTQAKSLSTTLRFQKPKSQAQAMKSQWEQKIKTSSGLPAEETGAAALAKKFGGAAKGGKVKPNFTVNKRRVSEPVKPLLSVIPLSPTEPFSEEKVGVPLSPKTPVLGESKKSISEHVSPEQMRSDRSLFSKNKSPLVSPEKLRSERSLFSTPQLDPPLSPNESQSAESLGSQTTEDDTIPQVASTPDIPEPHQVEDVSRNRKIEGGAEPSPTGKQEDDMKKLFPEFQPEDFQAATNDKEEDVTSGKSNSEATKEEKERQATEGREDAASSSEKGEQENSPPAEDLNVGDARSEADEREQEEESTSAIKATVEDPSFKPDGLEEQLQEKSSLVEDAEAEVLEQQQQQESPCEEESKVEDEGVKSEEEQQQGPPEANLQDNSEEQEDKTPPSNETNIDAIDVEPKGTPLQSMEDNTNASDGSLILEKGALNNAHEQEDSGVGLHGSMPLKDDSDVGSTNLNDSIAALDDSNRSYESMQLTDSSSAGFLEGSYRSSLNDSNSNGAIDASHSSSRFQASIDDIVKEAKESVAAKPQDESIGEETKPSKKSSLKKSSSSSKMKRSKSADGKRKKMEKKSCSKKLRKSTKSPRKEKGVIDLSVRSLPAIETIGTEDGQEKKEKKSSRKSRISTKSPKKLKGIIDLSIASADTVGTIETADAEDKKKGRSKSKTRTSSRSSSTGASKRRSSSTGAIKRRSRSSGPAKDSKSKSKSRSSSTDPAKKEKKEKKKKDRVKSQEDKDYEDNLRMLLMDTSIKIDYQKKKEEKKKEEMEEGDPTKSASLPEKKKSTYEQIEDLSTFVSPRVIKNALDVKKSEKKEGFKTIPIPDDYIDEESPEDQVHERWSPKPQFATPHGRRTSTANKFTPRASLRKFIDTLPTSPRRTTDAEILPLPIKEDDEGLASDEDRESKLPSAPLVGDDPLTEETNNKETEVQQQQENEELVVGEEEETPDEVAAAAAAAAPEEDLKPLEPAAAAETEESEAAEPDTNGEGDGKIDRDTMVLAEMNKMIQEAEDQEIGDEMDEEVVECLRKSAINGPAYRKQWYDCLSDSFFHIPSLATIIMDYSLIELAEEYYEEELPMLYSVAIRSVAAEIAMEEEEIPDYIYKLAT